MSDPVIRLRENGPNVVEFPVKIADHLGNEFQIPASKPAVALCRCGQSTKKPFRHLKPRFKIRKPPVLRRL